MAMLTAEEIEKRISDSYELPNNVLTAMPEPMVSVRTSTYQHAPYIRECIESVLAQKTNFPFEYIIGEDFSTDGTREIVYEYAKKYPDIIRVVTADYNVGMKANYLRCAISERGKYSAICEGDDYWTDPSKLQQQVDMLEAHPEYSMCFHNAKVIYEHNKKKPHPFAIYDKEIYTIQDVINKPWFIPTQSMLVRSSMRESPLWIYYIFMGDYASHLLLALKGGLACINKEMSVYRRHVSSLGAVLPKNYSTIKIIELLHYFDVYSNFDYHKNIESRVKKMQSLLYRLNLYQRPLWARLLSIDFYIYKFQTLLSKFYAKARKCAKKDGAL